MSGAVRAERYQDFIYRGETLFRLVISWSGEWYRSGHESSTGINDRSYGVADHVKVKGVNMLALRRAQKTLLERNTAVWVWQQKRAVSIAEIAGQFFIPLYVARKMVHNLMRNADGLRCRLETARGINSAGHRGLVKYFSVQHVPEDYHPAGEGKQQKESYSMMQDFSLQKADTGGVKK